MTARAALKNHSMPNFDVHSVVLLAFAALAIGLASTAQSQPSLAAPSPSSAATPALVPVAADAAPIPHNKITAQDIDAAFDRADRDRDGRLSRAEAEHFPMVSQRFEQFDTNHDGAISRAEFHSAAGQ